MTDARLNERVVILVDQELKSKLDTLCNESRSADGRPLRHGQYLRRCIERDWAARDQRLQEEIEEMSKWFNIAGGCPGGK